MTSTIAATAATSPFVAAHTGPGHDLRTMYRTDGTNTRYVWCRKCDEARELVSDPWGGPDVVAAPHVVPTDAEISAAQHECPEGRPSCPACVQAALRTWPATPAPIRVSALDLEGTDPDEPADRV